ncbi:hypothetical protein Kpol_260p3 [Vanderwaltozyma polyspora DSM 70294]|uniref:FAD/NAD(P)-binding domain-containing protein n=1 Tax=Vanderwaltozyma polyspora (strain ATCC 22028 / DSM 70294 / BCRC 21397 / CBS 2163 / NBRC 10782 / NRRL Y-8283 / UCD 57-17) TaxID=436907 RepID=A7TTF4_VANPO|nr:uncharacterized protein Kpol_260p3 [Vanderwaltozyma polyspora DSM 70294]EDO14453.1 hypothetical protein Kpol_260p3 [Vanderwaltozyma polyspora DSM 70294]
MGDNKRLAIIGGGPGGLAAARVFLENAKGFQVELFESDSEIGGVWHYCDDEDKEGRVMYDYLETNIPKELMKFSGYPFPDSVSKFPKRGDVWKYLKSYFKEFIESQSAFKAHLNTKVSNVFKKDGEWMVVVKDESNDVDEYVFDYVIFANGHYSTPRIPNEIPGLNQWFENNSAFHSKDFQNCEFAKGKNVIVIGNGSSGQDITIQLSSVAKKVYNSVHDVEKSQCVAIGLTNLIEIIPSIDETEWINHSVKLSNGKVLNDIDFIVSATGFYYDLRILEPNLRKDLLGTTSVSETAGTKMYNLWEQIFYVNDKTIAFSLLPQLVIPFPLAELQASVMVKVFTNKLEVPSTPQGNDDPNYHYFPNYTDIDYYRLLQSLLDSHDGDKDKFKPVKWDGEYEKMRRGCTELKRQRNLKLFLYAQKLRKEHIPYHLIPPEEDI